jgi:hypothetical protein
VLDWLERETEPASIAIVWLPMLPGDDAAAARSMAASFHDKRVAQFWDPGRLSGKQWSVDFQVGVARAGLDSLPPDHPYRPVVERWVADPASVPMWDVAYFYAPGVRWSGRIPPPTSWSKQMGFWGDAGNAAEDGADDTRPPSPDAAAGPESLRSGSDPIRTTVPDSLNGSAPGTPHATGRFWNDASPAHLIESDWVFEFASGMGRVMRTSRQH